MGRAEIRRFQRKADEVAAFLKPRLNSATRVKILAHTDTDGISSASILARCLRAYDVPFHLTFTNPLKPAELEVLAKEDYDMFVFLDQGSGQMEGIHKHLLGEEEHAVVVLDHHPGELPDHPLLAHLNPHEFELNGARDVCAAGVVYSVAESLDKKFRPLAALAIVGMLGDRQELPTGFESVNQVIVDRAIDLGIVKTSEGLKLIGRSQSPIAECLRLSIRPYLPGLTGNMQACKEMVEGMGIKLEDSTENLGGNQEVVLRDGLFARSETATRDEFRHTLWGPLYEVKIGQWAGPRDLHEYVAMIDACDRLGEPEIGFAAAMGDEDGANDAIALLRRYQEEMSKVLQWLERKKDYFATSPQMRHIWAGNHIDFKMIGEAMSLAMESGLVPDDLPVVAMAESGDEAKISARAMPEHARKGVHLGEALDKAARPLGGTGGGHDVAAGARVPLGKRDEFIARLEKILPQVEGI